MVGGIVHSICRSRFKNELNQMVFDQVEKYRRKCEELGQKPCGVSDSEGEEDIQIHRTFEWTGNLKKLFREVVQLKLKTYEVSKLRSISAEEYIKNFFEIDVSSSFITVVLESTSYVSLPSGVQTGISA